MRSVYRAAGWAVSLTVTLFPLSGTARAEEEAVTVTARGESEVSWDAAEQKALRDAVRQGAGVLLTSDTRVADFQLIRDAIYSRAAGYVRRRIGDPVKRRGLDDTYIVEITAEVARGKINDDTLAIKNLIEVMGRPRFLVEIEVEEGPKEMKTWVEGAINDHLERTGLNVLYVRAINRAVERQYQRALALGDKLRAAMLKLRMLAPYSVDITAVGSTSKEKLYGIESNLASAELQVAVAHADSGKLLASKRAKGRGGSPDRSGMRPACEAAVAEVFPQVLDRILYHWTEDLDVGWELTIMMHKAEFQQVNDLKKKISGLDEVKSASIPQAPQGGVAEIRVVCRLKASDLADRVKAWTGDRFCAGLEGPRVIAVEPCKPAPAPQPNAQPPQPEKAKPPATPTVEPAGTEKSSTATPTGSDLPAQALEPTVPQPQTPPAAPRRSALLPAAIVGGCVLFGIVFAAIILKKR